jgi:voltage-gated potassium channel
LLVIRALRLLRVFRILKLGHFLGQARVLRSALRASAPKIVVFLGTVLTVVLIVGTLMYLIEGESNGFTSIPRSIYWAIVTITTVGYGDIAPQTPIGQSLAASLMIMGYGIIAVPTGIVTVELSQASSHEVDRQSKRRIVVRKRPERREITKVRRRGVSSGQRIVGKQRQRRSTKT